MFSEGFMHEKFDHRDETTFVSIINANDLQRIHGNSVD